MILSTTPQIEGYNIREYKGVVTGETIIGANFMKDIFAGIRDIVGGRSASYEKVLRKAKDTAMQEMMERAQAMGAKWASTSTMRPSARATPCSWSPPAAPPWSFKLRITRIYRKHPHFLIVGEFNELN